MGAAFSVLRLVRWPGAVTAAANAGTGFLLAHHPASPGGAGAAFAAVTAGALVYTGGVVLNDVADVERDRTTHPSRPLPRGTVVPSAAARFGIVLLAAGVAVSLLAGPWVGAASLTAALAALAYDFGPRRIAAVGALCLAAARAANGLAGVVAASGGIDPVLTPGALPSLAVAYPAGLFVLTAVLTVVSTFEDRRPGPWAAGAAALSLWLVTAAAWILFPRTTWPTAPAIPLALHLGTLVAAARAATDPAGPGMGLVVRCGVFGFLLGDAAWLLGQGRYDAGLAAVLVWLALRLALLRARS